MTPKRFFYVLLALNVAVTAVGAAGYYFALGYVRSTTARLSTQLGEQTRAQTQLDELNALKVQYNREIVPVLPLLDEALPQTKNQTEILAQLQRVATEAGLRITGATFVSPVGLPTNTSQTVASGKVLALPVNFQISGTYAQLQNFLGRVERLSRFTNVTSLAVSRPDKSRPIVYSMTVNAYVKP